MYQQLWGYKVEEKLYLGVREQNKVEYHWFKTLVSVTATYIQQNVLAMTVRIFLGSSLSVGSGVDGWNIFLITASLLTHAIIVFCCVNYQYTV
jgi:hypothetical protein